MLVAPIPHEVEAQQKELPEVTMLTAVPNFAFAAIWVAEQLKYFEAGGHTGEDHTGAKRVGVFERCGRPFDEFLRVHVGRTCAGASRRRAGDGDPSA